MLLLHDIPVVNKRFLIRRSSPAARGCPRSTTTRGASLLHLNLLLNEAVHTIWVVSIFLVALVEFLDVREFVQRATEPCLPRRDVGVLALSELVGVECPPTEQRGIFKLVDTRTTEMLPWDFELQVVTIEPHKSCYVALREEESVT